MSVRRWDPTPGSKPLYAVHHGDYVLHDDHLADVGKKVAEARRAAFMECLEQYEKITRGNPLTFLTFSDWLKARAEGRGE